jgi:hypothetical protein
LSNSRKLNEGHSSVGVFMGLVIQKMNHGSLEKISHWGIEMPEAEKTTPYSRREKVRAAPTL